MWTRALCVGAVLGMIACASKPGPEIASSATQATYAEVYPGELQAIGSGFSQSEGEIQRIAGEMPRYPDDFKKAPDWNVVQSIYERADEAGKSYAYAERHREVEGARTFFEAEQSDIAKKVSWSCQYAAKQKNCDVELGGVAAHALKEGVDTQLEKRLRSANEAHLIIERYREALGKDNVSTLEKQADDISYASYLVHIELVERKLRLDRMIEDAAQVQSTADAFIESERNFQKEPGRTDAEKKASEARVADMVRSKTSLESSKKQASDLQKRTEDRIKAAKKTYADAVTALKEKVRTKLPQSATAK
ncbi:hypothetical protein LZC95_01070 [Pendulispora brunnea]|uniref:Uncharacterized protein n=1 Tax=Pendulispora brunnea TaxID=2905690 RepID=A0ABZ2K9R8_9BACT